MIKRPKDDAPQDREPIDWRRVSDANAPQPPSRRGPFQVGPDDEAASDGSAIDPWRELLARGSMHEVLASVRRVSGLPDEEGPPATSARRADQAGAAKPTPFPVRPRPRREPPAEQPAEKPAAAGQGRAASRPRTEEPRAGLVPFARAASEGGRQRREREGEPEGERPAEPASTGTASATRSHPLQVRHQDPETGRGASYDYPESSPLAAELAEVAAAWFDEAPEREELDFVPRRPGQPTGGEPRRRYAVLGLGALLVILLGAGIGFTFAYNGGDWPAPLSSWANQRDAAPVDRPAGEAAGQATQAEPGPTAARDEPARFDGRIEPRQPPPLDDETSLAAVDETVTITDAPGPPIPMLRPPLAPAVDAQEEPVAATPDEGEEIESAAVADGPLAPLFLGRVFVHYAGSSVDGVNRARAERIVRALEDEGYRIGELRRIGFDIRVDSIRYFFEDDQRAAERLRQSLPPALAGTTQVIDFTTYEPRPRPGTIELWLSGAG